MITTTTPLAIPFRNIIKNNIFMENDNHIDMASNGCLYIGNVFLPGYTYTPTVVLRTDQAANPGDDNLVTGNFFGELDYSVAGGFDSGAADHWAGNFSGDTAEAEVSDNGLTLTIPS